MNANDTTTATGSLGIVLTGPDGKVKVNTNHENLVVNTGLAYFISRAVGTAKPTMSHMALGSGTATPAAGDTQLQSQLDTRASLDSTSVSGNNDEQVVYAATFGPGVATGAVTEAGIFNGATGSDMLCRTEFPVVNKQSDDTMVVTWTVQLNAS